MYSLRPTFAEQVEDFATLSFILFISSRAIVFVLRLSVEKSAANIAQGNVTWRRYCVFTGPGVSVRRARFAIGPAAAPTTPMVVQEQTIRDLCATGAQPRASLSRIYLTSNNEIVQRGEVTQNFSTHSQHMRRVSFRSLLHEPRERSMIGSLLTAKQSISLGSVVVSTVLQLSATSWLARTWSTEDLFFIKPSGASRTEDGRQQAATSTLK